MNLNLDDHTCMQKFGVSTKVAYELAWKHNKI
jgi:hypothetical protein